MLEGRGDGMPHPARPALRPSADWQTGSGPAPPVRFILVVSKDHHHEPRKVTPMSEQANGGFGAGLGVRPEWAAEVGGLLAIDS
ncbi:MAG: hypothetical protein F4X36_08730 [Gammaproteobacteria bacterium]|nr:hypothetical protein [Gammaproteobacteria bacterium]